MIPQGVDVDVGQLGQLDERGQGGQGVVYAIAGSPGMLYKQFLDYLSPNCAELARLVGVPASVRPADRRLIRQHTAWPLNRVMRGSRCVGFLMREVPSSFLHVTEDEMKLKELSFLIFPPKQQWADLRQPSLEERKGLASRYIDLLETLHRHQVVFGDISMKNLLWTVDGAPAVFAIDCDGFRIAGRPPTVPQADTPDWIDPHARPGEATFETDRYKLALVILRILLWEPYVTPAQVVDDPARARRLSPMVVELAHAANGPVNRPTADAWRLAMAGRSLIRLTPADLDDGLAPPKRSPDEPSPAPPQRRIIPMTPLAPPERR